MLANEMNFPYNYPRGLNLKPGSETHEMLVKEVLKRADGARAKIQNRFETWKKIDRTLTAYVPLDEHERRIKQNDERKPVSIVVPISYATRETLLTYMVAAFFEQPIFRYEPGGPEDVIGVALLERHIARQVTRMKVALKLHTMFSDAIGYGIGPVACTFRKKEGYRDVERSVLGEMFGKFMRLASYKESGKVTLYEGNDLINIDPYKFLPDPNVSPECIQDGEFVGWIDQTNVTTLLAEERTDSNIYNVKYVKEDNTVSKSRLWNVDSTGRYERFGDSSSYGSYPSVGDKTDRSMKPVDIIHMYINLIPKDWKLGDSEYPAKWFFRVAGDKILLEARPLGLRHDMFPIAIDTPTFDGHRSTPVSLLEVGYPMQETVDWLFQSHIANVRKAVHDMIVYDPSIINTFDLKRPGPGKYIRTRRAAFGRSVKDAIMQLNIVDITRQNIGDVQYVINLMHDIYGTVDPIRGVRRQGGDRVTATEISSDRTAAMSRLEKVAKISAMTAMQDIGYMFASHTQQLMSTDSWVKIIGRYEDELRAEYGEGVKGDFVKVDPRSIDVNYDVVVNDGTIPGNTDAQAWIQMFQIISTQPQLAQTFDIVRVFRHIARSLGAKNVRDFEVKAKVVPDERVENEAQAGNIVPIGQMIGGM